MLPEEEVQEEAVLAEVVLQDQDIQDQGQSLQEAKALQIQGQKEEAEKDTKDDLSGMVA